MADDIFGLENTPPEVRLGLAEVEEPEVEEEGPQAEETVEGTPEAKAEAEVEAPEAEAEAQKEPEPEPEAEVEESALDEVDPYQQWLDSKPEGTVWAGKYNTPDDIVKGYNESQEMFRRAAESRRAEAEARAVAEQREAQLAQILQEAIPYLRQAADREQILQGLAEQYKQDNGEYPRGYTGPPSQQMLAPADVNRLVEQRLAAERASWQAEAERWQEFEQTEAAVMGFYSDHPEVEPRGFLDNEITDTMQALNDAWSATTGEEVDMSDRGTLEVLYEAAQRPALRQVLAMRPEYFDSEAGLNLARRDASLLEGAPAETQQVRQVPASKVGQNTGQRKPFAESAVTGAEAEEQDDENDPWLQIKREYKRGKDQASVFQFE